MIYKIGNVDDLESIAFDNDNAKELCTHYVSILSSEYGTHRNVDTDNGGYILYVTSGTSTDEIKTFFDYTQNLVELVDLKGGICAAVYILSCDYGVVTVMSLADMPPEILKEI